LQRLGGNLEPHPTPYPCAPSTAMPLLIDGYNVLHATMPPALAGLDEAGLCRALARTPWQAEPIVVVCDGRPGPLGVVESPVSEVELVYSGPTRTADDVIIERIDADSAPRRLIVVSTDHAIRKAARRRRAISWTSDQFIHRLVAAMHNDFAPPNEGKPDIDTLPPQQVRDWLDAFGVEDDGDT
ncbi:MAG: NYN domain-containing protein, partial [Pirellulales bacterium]